MEKIKKYVSDWCMAVALVVLLGAVALMVSTNNTLNNASEAFERMDASHVDTQVIEVDWALGYEGDTVRMVCGWMFDTDTIEDQEGNVWEVENMDLSENDFLLLWISDSKTVDDVSDDVIIKVWREVA